MPDFIKDNALPLGGAVVAAFILPSVIVVPAAFAAGLMVKKKYLPAFLR